MVLEWLWFIFTFSQMLFVEVNVDLDVVIIGAAGLAIGFIMGLLIGIPLGSIRSIYEEEENEKAGINR